LNGLRLSEIRYDLYLFEQLLKGDWNMRGNVSWYLSLMLFAIIAGCIVAGSITGFSEILKYALTTSLGAFITLFVGTPQVAHPRVGGTDV